MDKLKVKNDFKHFYLRLIFQRIQVSKLNHCLFHCTVWTNTHTVFIVRDSYANLLTRFLVQASMPGFLVCYIVRTVTCCWGDTVLPKCREVKCVTLLRKFQAIIERGGWPATVPPWCLMNKKTEFWFTVGFMVQVKLGWGRGKEEKGCWALSSKSFTNRAGLEPPSI